METDPTFMEAGSRVIGKSVVFVPTAEESPTTITRYSAALWQVKFGIQTVAFSTLANSESYSYPGLLFIGARDIGLALARLEYLVGEDTQVVFGEVEYSRGYGGAANVGLMLAMLLQTPIAYRFDADVDYSETVLAPDELHGVISGHYVEETDHPRIFWRNIAPEFLKLIDIVEQTGDEPLKSGCLTFSLSAAESSPFPVWNYTRLSIKPRGEIYDWAEELFPRRITVHHQPNFFVRHLRDYKSDFSAWLRATTLKSEYTFIRRQLWCRSSFTLAERVARRRSEAIARLEEAPIEQTEKDGLLEIITKHAPRFAESAFAHRRHARRIWNLIAHVLRNAKNREFVKSAGASLSSLN